MTNKPDGGLGWQVVPMTERHAEEVCGWRFEPPYDVYNNDPWEVLRKLEIEIGDPKLRQEQYAAVVDPEDGELMGYAQFFPIQGVTRLGLAMRPDLCGDGLGPAFVSLLVQEAKRRKPGDEIDLEVLIWNRRAKRAYEKAGFRLTDTYERGTPEGPKMFHCMVYKGR
ncbi:GNAT family N-acetyltransferase [Paenibacillus sp. D51F]|uniref:GNAT family N-acetyltransferase n=1 Tax=unclassified Paenibacillus TaxID=185978 RepID=UPI0009564DD4|nr:MULTISPECIES: GNAT family N-acetyltransferase [unclassified Paenibacillus]ASS67757.1 GNAT family N-acetyltransferase [Paenibacillus sp. RUD330]SIR61441.1 Protein N-acetyltransferase, RimJ/RimL family [Paenibacillus sp. RU4X]SIR70063.1 Protein N-acetyltransferase, RimJ/RimL family [Paenibacillus sp. RU4T]